MAKKQGKWKQLLEQLQQKQAEANEANEARYAEQLGVLRGSEERTRGLYDQAAGELRLPATFGQTARRRATRAAKTGTAEDVQSLTNRGLGNTTIANSLARQRGRDLEEANLAIDERVDVGRAQYGAMRSGLFGRQAGAEAGGARATAGAIERRTDEGPDMNMYAQLLQMLGSAKGDLKGGGANNNQLMQLLMGMLG